MEDKKPGYIIKLSSRFLLEQLNILLFLSVIYSIFRALLTIFMETAIKAIFYLHSHFCNISSDKYRRISTICKVDRYYFFVKITLFKLLICSNLWKLSIYTIKGLRKRFSANEPSKTA